MGTFIIGAVMISPSGIASACSGGHLDVTCTTNGTFLRWYITRPDIDNTTFSFSRTSPQGTLPLISMLTISPVSEIMNGIQVKCEDVVASINSSTTIVHVINSQNDVG